VIEQARYVDLTVLGQADPEPSSLRSVSPEEVVLFSGRPTLIVPAVGRFEHVGRHALIAWNASREAACVVGDAMPLLVHAQAVTVLSINSAGRNDGKQQAIDLAHHLARHGIEAEATATDAEHIAVGEVLLARASDCGADLIVMGAYGHSRSRQLLLGGATRHVLKHTTVPVLMGH
jgi:nucleotide-binding universal stress UspA family protein